MPHAFLWQNGVMTDLGVLPGDEDSGAGAINNLGQIVGSSGRTDPETYEVTSRSFLYENGVMTALPVPSSRATRGTSTMPASWSARCGPAAASPTTMPTSTPTASSTNLNSLIPAGSGLHLALRHRHQQRRPDRRRGL